MSLFDDDPPPPPPPPPKPPSVPCPVCHGTGEITHAELETVMAGPGKVSRTPAPTSAAAAHRKSNVVNFGTERYHILDLLDTEWTNANASEVSPLVAKRRHVDPRPNQIGSRFGDLRDAETPDGVPFPLIRYVYDDDGKILERPTSLRTGDTGQVYEITDLGRAAVAVAREKEAKRRAAEGGS